MIKETSGIPWQQGKFLADHGIWVKVPQQRLNGGETVVSTKYSTKLLSLMHGATMCGLNTGVPLYNKLNEGFIIYK